MFKDHFIAGLATTDKLFPMHLWCRLIPQSILTLNLLCPSRLNPRLSAEAQLNGAFDFNKTPLAPPGTKAIVHKKPAARQTWAPHGVDGWHIGPAREHYRCYDVYITKTASMRVTDTMELFPHSQTMPKTSSANAAIQAALQLTHALQNLAPAAPFANIGQPQLIALQELASIFTNSANGTNSTAIEPLAEPPAPPRVAPVATVNNATVPPPRVVAMQEQAPTAQPVQSAHTNNANKPQPKLIPPDNEQPPTPTINNEPVHIQPGKAQA